MLSVLLLGIKTSFIQLSPKILRPGHPLVFFAWLLESVKCSQKGRTINITTTENKLYLKADYSATPLWVAHYTESFFSCFFFSADRQWCVPITSDERIKSASRISVQVYPRRNNSEVTIPFAEMCAIICHFQPARDWKLERRKEWKKINKNLWKNNDEMRAG